MFGQLLTILAGILALIGAGALSFTYLEQSVGPREVTKTEFVPIPVVVEKKEVPKAATSTQIAQKNPATKVTVVVPQKTNGSLTPKATTVEKTVVAPGPLRAIAPLPTTTKSVVLPASVYTLTAHGVIEYTNGARSLNGGLPALVENETLDRDAGLKLADMFAKQYFEHVSPTGVGPAELAQTVGYAYVVVGENLALGDFEGDQGVVTAWMNSPGHRANILNAHYQEIGVAVGKGMYEGRETGFAGQSFGKPLSSCPAIDANLKTQIDANNVTILDLRAQLDAKKTLINSTSQGDPNYNTYVGEFNAIIPTYNTLVETNRVNVSTYNAEGVAFNSCISAASAH